jgi:hypothetical protein
MSAAGKQNRKGHFYEAPAGGIRLVPGVRVKAACRVDIYTGSAEDLVASGIVPPGLFPGDPGMPSVIVSLRPAGVQRVQDRAWCFTPGFLRVQRLAVGGFRVERTVDHEEQKRRHAAQVCAERERWQAVERARDALEARRPAAPVSDVQRAREELAARHVWALADEAIAANRVEQELAAKSPSACWALGCAMTVLARAARGAA